MILGQRMLRFLTLLFEGTRVLTAQLPPRCKCHRYTVFWRVTGMILGSARNVPNPYQPGKGPAHITPR